MAQFDVHALADGYVIDCQSDFLGHYDTRFVVPLMSPETGPQAAKRFNPMFAIKDRPMVMYTQYAAAVPCQALGPKIMSLADQRDAIVSALDMLVTGF